MWMYTHPDIHSIPTTEVASLVDGLPAQCQSLYRTHGHRTHQELIHFVERVASNKRRVVGGFQDSICIVMRFRQHPLLALSLSMI